MQLNSQSGFSLTELLISLTLGLLITALAHQGLQAINTSYQSQTAYQHLTLELESIMFQITRDIRRSASLAISGQDAVVAAGGKNPFSYDTSSSSALFSFATIESSTMPAGSYDCLLFAYDANHDGIPNGNSERFGYRWSEQTLKTRSNGAACNQSGWVRISDDQNLQIRTLRFTPLRQSLPSNSLFSRCSILIEIEGSSLKQPDLVLTLSHRLSLGNLFKDSDPGSRLCQ